MEKKYELHNKEKIEEEKILLGGNIYKNANYLPLIKVRSEDTASLREDLNIIDKIGKQFVEDIIRLHADLYIILACDQEDNKDIPINRVMNEIAIQTCAKINLALEQVREITQIIADYNRNKPLNIQLSGKQYCFISILLNELFMTYTSLIVILLSKRYIDEIYINAIRERLNLLMSAQYEQLRQKFQTVQCLEFSNDSLKEPLMTIH